MDTTPIPGYEPVFMIDKTPSGGEDKDGRASPEPEEEEQEDPEHHGEDIEEEEEGASKKAALRTHNGVNGRNDARPTGGEGSSEEEDSDEEEGPRVTVSEPAESKSAASAPEEPVYIQTEVR